MPGGIGEEFQQQTKYHPQRMPGPRLDRAGQPGLYKSYPGSKKIDLPPHGPPESAPLHELLRRRKSIRQFSGAPLAAEELSHLLWASTGIQRSEGGCQFRTAPSAGALYPIETYPIINNVRGIGKGVYHYAIQHHQLEEVKAGDFRHHIAAAALGQQMCANAAAVFVWTALFRRTTWKYGQRGYRYIYLDAGHIAQNLALASTALGLASCEVGALFDDEVNDIIDADGIEESVVCMCAVGHH